jgi:plastocyanin
VAAPEDKTAPESEPAPIDPATTATLEGKVLFSGEIPKPAPILLNAECQAHSSGVFDEKLVVNPDKTVKNVLVHVVKGLVKRKYPLPAAGAVLDQKGCVYSPHVLAVRAGQPIEIKNSDGVLHNVNSVAAKRNTGFNRAMPSGIQPLKATFKTPELSIPFKCDVHPWMGSYVHVLDHPFFAVTGTDGTFRITGLPPGTYTIEALHESLKSQTAEVTLAPKETKSLDLKF